MYEWFEASKTFMRIYFTQHNIELKKKQKKKQEKTQAILN